MPDDWSLDDAIVVALLVNGKPAWVAWQPSTGLYRTHRGKRWHEPKPATQDDGRPMDVPAMLTRTLRRGLDGAPAGSTFRVAGAWLGYLYPSDLPKTVMFEPPTGGAIDLDTLRADYAESLRSQQTISTGKFGEDWTKQAKRRIAWAKKWLKDQAKAAKPKKTREPKPKKPATPKTTKAPPMQPEAAIAVVAVAEEPTTCTTCTHASDTTKEIETMTSKKTSKKASAKKAGTKKASAKKASAKKASAKKASAKKASAKKAGTKKASAKKAGKKAVAATPTPTNGVEQPKRGPGRPRKTPAAPSSTPASTSTASTSGADTHKRARRRLARHDLVRFRKRSQIAAALRIAESTTFRVEHGLEIRGERYVMIRLGKSNAAIPIPEGQLVAIERAEEFPADLRACVAQLGRYKGKLRPQIRHFLRELQRRA